MFFRGDHGGCILTGRHLRDEPAGARQQKVFLRQGQATAEGHQVTNVGVKLGPGLVVTGGDSCAKGGELESRHCILDGHFSHTYLL